MSNTTQDSFLEAFANLEEVISMQFEYRVYYNPTTNECISKSIEGQDGTYIVVDKNEYEQIDFCPNYYVKNGKVIKKKLDFSKQVLLKRADYKTSFKAVRDVNIFALDDDDESFASAVDYWSVRDWND